MQTKWKAERTPEYWAFEDAETFDGYFRRVARQFSTLCGEMIDMVESAVNDNLTAEAANRLIDSLGGTESNHVSAEIMQDQLVQHEIAAAEGIENAGS